MIDQGTILAVDDSAESLAQLDGILTAAGFQMYSAGNGEAALAAVEARAPDLILLEFRLQDMDGLEVCRRLKARGETRRIPIIMVGAAAGVKVWVESLQLGAADCLTRPFQADELLRRVGTQLALSRADAAGAQPTAALPPAHEPLESEIARRGRVEDELRQNLERAERSRRAMLSALEDQKRAEEVVRQHVRQLEVLSRAGQQINTVLEMPAVLRQLIAAAREVTGAASGTAGLMRDDQMVFTEYDLGGQLIPIDYRFAAGHGVPGWVMQTRAPYVSGDAEHDPHVIPEIQQALGFRNLADVPIFNRRGELLGCFEMHNKPGGFGGTDLLLLESLASSAAIALENAAMLAERKRAEEALRDSEERFRRAVLDSPFPILLHAEDGTILQASNSWCEITGYTCQELATMADWTERAYGETKTLVQADIEALYGLDRRKYEGDYAIRTKSGDTRIWDFSSAPLGRLPDGRRLVMSMAMDVTEGRQAETALRERERQLATLMSNLPGMAYRCRNDRHWTMEFVSDGAQALTGYPASELLGNRGVAYADLIHPEDREAVRNQVQAGLARREPFVLHYRLRTATGMERWVWEQGQGVFDARQQLLGLEGFVADITERINADQTLRKLSRAVEQSPASVVITDVQGNIEYVNPKFEQVTGYTLEEVRGKNPRLLKSGEMPDEAYAGMWRTIAAGGEWTGEFHNRRKDGSLYWENAILSGIKNDAGHVTHFLAVKEDITARKRLEQERAGLEAKLRQHQKLESIGTLAGGVAHEINNPINGIMNYAQLIQDRLPAESPLAEFTGEILHETQRVVTIVRNLLTFSRDEKQSHSPARLTDIVEGTLSLIRTVIRHDQITLRVDVAGNLPELKCRSQQLQQVLMNLMTNARDALNARYPGHDADKVLHVTAGEFAKEGRCWIRVTVEDHGTGITPAVRERMFDPFYTTKPRDQGTGLGLAISHGIVKEHHGELTVESEPGHFTRMHLDLPVDNEWSV